MAYLAFRVSTANLAPITDCDEVFNYWEPLHFVLYGTGMQTWEYAPQYGLRTYAYLLPIAGVAKFFQYLLDALPSSFFSPLSKVLLVTSTTTSGASLSLANTVLMNELPSLSHNKPLLFALLRSTLAIISCYSELSFLSSIHDVFGSTVAHWTALCSLTGAGNFHAGQAFLPSSTVMILWRLSAANQLKENHAWSILWGLLAVLAVGWPFCAVLFVSTGVWALWKASGLGSSTSEDEKNKKFQLGPVIHVLVRTAIHAILIQAMVMAIDYYFYGQILSPIWNIFVYNAQSGGDELYGVEPLSYYIKNLLLNFNLVSLLGVASLPLITFKHFVKRFFPRPEFCNHDTQKCNEGTGSMEILVLVPMYIWMGIVLPRPHKEERFLFPIYPMICFGASITMKEAISLLNNIMSKKQGRISRKVTLWIGLALLSPSAMISVSRSLALCHYYSAPLDLYRDLFSHAVTATSLSVSNGEDTITHVCTAGEWYRFPSSFFLPPNHQLGFLKSSFTGQLPQPFTQFGSKKESLDVMGVGSFNDINKEEMDRYIDIDQCAYVVELVPSSFESSDNTSRDDDIPECLKYMDFDSSAGSSWTQIASYDYLDADSTPLLHRILYFPVGMKGQAIYKGYNLYARRKRKLW